ncbi:MAG: ATP-dependent Clp protease ATP-binding subunit, partial [Firmicutes bacterium]|nr:ATP-dependent Clp protease ATP-binding subunit [Bacillota bacterium]
MPQISGSKNLISVLSNTLLIAKECNSDMGTEHLLCGLLSVPSAKSAAIFDKAGLSLKKVQQFLTKSQAPLAAPPMYTTNVNTILKNAERFSKEQGYGAVRTEFVLYALLLQGDCVAARILQSTVGIKKLKSITEDFILSQNQSQQDVSSISQRTHLHSQRRGDFGQLQGQAGQDSQKRQDLSHLSLSGQSVTDGQADCQSLPSQLLKLGTDMTRAMATKPTDPLIGRDEEIERIVQILCRKSKNNPVLVGEPGVGKTAVVEGLAKRIASGQVPPFLLDKTIFSLDIASLMAGTRYRGDLEERLKEAIDLITNSKNIIIFIDEIHTILKADGQKGDIGPADILKPFLARGQLQTIGATTIDEYRKYIEKDKAFERRFLPVYIDPPSVAQTIKIISGLRQNLEKFHNVTLTDEAIEAAAKLSDRYITDRFLPDKAIDLIDEAMSMAKVGCANSCADQSKSDEALVKLKAQKLDFLSRELYAQASKIDDQIKQLEQAEQQQRANNDKNQQTILSQKMAQIGFDDIAKVVSKWTKIPVGKIGDQQSITLLGLSSALKTRVIGQDGAIDGVCDAIKRSKTGLADPNRPIGTFLFVGPSGVGKTELSKAVAAEVMGDESSLIRLDMSEYLESHSVSKLIGAPPGYVGHDDGGQLTEQVRRRP